jgi:hypothetical protein
MHWILVPIEDEAVAVARTAGEPSTSPKFEELSERAQDQAKKVYKMIQLACKSELVGAGKVRVQASGYAHHEDRMPVGEKDFIALSIGKVD